MDKEKISGQLDFVAVLSQFRDFRTGALSQLLGKEVCSIACLEEAIKAQRQSETVEVLIALSFVIKAGFFLGKWVKAELDAEVNPERFLLAARAHLRQITIAENESLLERPSVKAILSIVAKIELLTATTEVRAVFTSIGQIVIPFEFTAIDNPFKRTGDHISEDGVIGARPPVVSVVFTLDGQLWANPQVVKPALMYKILGRIRVNYWPEGYEKLLLFAVSTSDNRWFTLSIPEIKRFPGESTDIEGTVTFHHAQANFDQPISVKLLCQVVGKDLPEIDPVIIGHYQLKVKVLNEHSFPFLIPYTSLNMKMVHITTDIEAQMTGLLQEEKRDFVLLLSNILNYQGYCAEQGTYKGVEEVSEAEFKEQLLTFLIAGMRLPKLVRKEEEVAGGRVEINYNGVILELKVERDVSDRKRVMDKYKGQAASYATGKGKRLSILCILDLTKKVLPPAPTENNVFLIEPDFHGFTEMRPDAASRLAIVFIDGNTLKPSDYK
ncbi:MAG TPA: hypothetical protein VGM30_19750 [Puia sp.]